jgi:hypothetical protein
LVTPADVDEAWAKWAYVTPVAMSSMQSDHFKKATKLTSQLHLADDVQQNPSAPFYEPPSRHKLDGPLLQKMKKETTDDMETVQSTEARKCGVSGTSDGARVLWDDRTGLRRLGRETVGYREKRARVLQDDRTAKQGEVARGPRRPSTGRERWCTRKLNRATWR